jgi:hypothetical protein
MRFRSMLVFGALAGLMLTASPRPASALSFTADMSVQCLSGTAAVCNTMGFLLTTNPSLYVWRFVIVDTEYSRNPLTFDLAGATIYEGTDTTGTNVTAKYSLSLPGGTGNSILAQDLGQPYDVLAPLYFVVNALTPGSIHFFEFGVRVFSPPRDQAELTDLTVRVVPEPLTLLLLGAGVLGTASRIRRHLA